jgi:hypothetical protein
MGSETPYTEDDGLENGGLEEELFNIPLDDLFLRPSPQELEMVVEDAVEKGDELKLRGLEARLRHAAREARLLADKFDEVRLLAESGLRKEKLGE